MLLQNQVAFDSLPKTMVKSMVMIIGEYDYEVKSFFLQILKFFVYTNVLIFLSGYADLI